MPDDVVKITESYNALGFSNFIDHLAVITSFKDAWQIMLAITSLNKYYAAPIGYVPTYESETPITTWIVIHTEDTYDETTMATSFFIDLVRVKG